MERLLVHAEGLTEVRFVRGILREHLLTKGYREVSARVVGSKKSGICTWPSAFREILNHLKEDQGRIVTTMVDFYGLPGSGGRAWPGRAEAAGLNGVSRKAACVQGALHAAVSAAIGDARRFVPFVVMHEFEGLLFSDCGAFARAIGRVDLEAEFRKVRGEVDTPEEINDSPTTAPSKCIKALFSGYQKPRQGEDAVREIGLARIRKECPLFDGWVKQLEALAG
jgi:hypothetical protein